MIDDGVEFIQPMWLIGQREERASINMGGYTIYASRKQSSHGPRIKFYHSTNRNDSISISISRDPKIVAGSDPSTTRSYKKYETEIKSWIRTNYDHLMRFWNDDQFSTGDFKNAVINNTV